MGRASVHTYLALDRWAKILGLDPLHFNGITSALRPARNCHQPWMQYAWQDADRVGREDVAEAIAQAESELIEALGFTPLPDWIAGEVVRTARPMDPTTTMFGAHTDIRGRYQSVQTAMGQVISGGIRASSLISTPTIAAGNLTWLDLDGDSYFETMQVLVPTTVADPSEIRVYFPGESGDDRWEIRPLRSVSIAGGNVTILIDRHLLVLPDLWEALNPSAVDGDVNANFLTSLDVYRVYNDPSQQIQLQWERIPSTCECGSVTCAMCAWATQWACLQARDPRLGFVTFQPADWNADDEQFDSASLGVDRQPDRLRLWYRAGWQGPANRIARPLVEMDPLMERIITLYSVTLLDRNICTCDNVETFIQRWREDRALVGTDGAKYQFPSSRNSSLDCPWGTKEGAIWAWRQAVKYALGRGVL